MAISRGGREGVSLAEGIRMRVKDLIQYHLTLTFFQNGLPLHGETRYSSDEWDKVQDLWRGVCNNVAVTKCWVTLSRECRGIDENDGVCGFSSDSEIVLWYER